jgi:hypothetical protein
MRTSKHHTPKSAPAASADLVEQHAAHVAGRRGKSRTTDADREKAYHELKRTAPKVSERDSPAH